MAEEEVGWRTGRERGGTGTQGRGRRGGGKAGDGGRGWPARVKMVHPSCDSDSPLLSLTHKHRTSLQNNPKVCMNRGGGGRKRASADRREGGEVGGGEVKRKGVGRESCCNLSAMNYSGDFPLAGLFASRGRYNSELLGGRYSGLGSSCLPAVLLIWCATQSVTIHYIHSGCSPACLMGGAWSSLHPPGHMAPQ